MFAGKRVARRTSNNADMCIMAEKRLSTPVSRRTVPKIGSREAPFFVLRELRELRALSVIACLLAS